jgi:hypothetical protein
MAFGLVQERVMNVHRNVSRSVYRIGAVSVGAALLQILAQKGRYETVVFPESRSWRQEMKLQACSAPRLSIEPSEARELSP